MSTMSMGDATRNASQIELRTCPVCERTLPLQGRGTYCGPACRQRAFRLRHRQATRPTLDTLTQRLRREQLLIAQTVYECPSCSERFVGDRRCGECNRMCRKVGLGSECGGCGEIITITDLLGTQLDGGALV
jgi:hypothetical protein